MITLDYNETLIITTNINITTTIYKMKIKRYTINPNDENVVFIPNISHYNKIINHLTIFC